MQTCKMRDNYSSETITLICQLRHHISLCKRKENLRHLKRYIRIKKLLPLVSNGKQIDSRSLCTDLFCETLSDKTECAAEFHHRKTDDHALELLTRKRTLAIEYIARRQLVNAKNSVLKIVQKRFFIYKRNFRLSKHTPWVKELPLKPNFKNPLYFSASVLRLNKNYLFDIYYRNFKTLFRDYEILDAHTYCFRVARRLNELAYCVNAIDHGEFNALNFLFKIYRTQQFDFHRMIQEITNDEPLPSPDPGVLHDNVLAVFTRINYFDYNDLTGELKPCIDNALFTIRSDLYPFLVTEYLLLRFMLKSAPVDIRRTVTETLSTKYNTNTVLQNVCQLFPGVFILLYILYFEHNDCIDTKGLLEMIVDARTSAQCGDYIRVTSHLKEIAKILCGIIFEFEQGNLRIPETLKTTVLVNWGFFLYSYLMDTPTITTLPFLVRE